MSGSNKTNSRKDEFRCYGVRDIPGKGKGVVAIRQIDPGELIIYESPLIVVPWWVRHSNYPRREMKKVLMKALDELTDEQEDEFFNLCDCKSDSEDKKTVVGIWRTNNFALGRTDSKTSNGLFPGLSRFNHSCVPSAEFHWNSLLQRQEIRSIRQIQTDEEITVCYFTAATAILPIHERKEYLLTNYGFPCDCSDCSLRGDEASENDRLRRRVQECADEIKKSIYEDWEDILEDENINNTEDDESVDESYRKALDLAVERYELMTKLGFKVISRLDALQMIIDIANDFEDDEYYANYAFKYAQIGIQLAGYIYGKELKEYRSWISIYDKQRLKVD